MVAAGLMPADDRILLVDRGVGLYARYVHCEIHVRACQLWRPPWHFPAPVLKPIYPDTWRSEVAGQWANFGVPRWFIETID
jgi:hypothetical protein